MAQLLISGLGLIIFLGSSLSFCIAALYAAIDSGLSTNTIYPFATMAWSTAFFSALAIPSIVYATARLINRPAPALKIKNLFSISSLLMMIWPLLVFIGLFVTRNTLLSLTILPILQIIVIVVPIFWFVQVGQRNLSDSQPQRDWGLLNFSLFITPIVVIVAELLVLLFLGVLVLMWMSSYPGFQEQITRLGQRLIYSQLNPDAITRIVAPILQQPITISLSMFVSAGMVPIIEELFKSMGLWFLPKHMLTPAKGFKFGLICGATFGMVESLGMMASAPIEGWAGIIIGRLGTGLLHTVTTGLIGWGLATAWSKKHYLDLGLSYLVSVFLHGLWNMFGLILGLFPMIEFSASGFDAELFSRLSIIAPIALIVLIITMLLILIGSNRRLSQSTSI